MPVDDGRLEEQALRAMTRARSALVLEHPFFGALALRLRFRADAAVRDLWTDGRGLGFNPAWAASQPEKKLVAAQAHEILHLACGHHVRRKGREPRLWNRACDFAVNQLLEDAGFALPEGFAVDPAYRDCPADEIYADLARLRDEEPNGGARRGLHEEEGASADAGGRPLGGAGAEAPRRGREQPPDASGTKKRGIGDKSGTGDSAAEGEESEGSGGAAFVGEVRDHPLLDGNEEGQAQRAAEREAHIALVQAMQRALHAGDMPGNFMRLLTHVIRPRLDWRELLRRFLESRVDNDSTWSTPNRRYLHQNLYLPSRREPSLPRLVLAVDSSGSVDEAKLAAFCAELSAILDDYDTTLTVLFHDTGVRDEQTFGRRDLPFTLTPQGGGGTDYRPVCEYIERENLDPVCLLWFTDLECGSFPEEPEYPVLWITSGREDNAPPFGEWLRMPA